MTEINSSLYSKVKLSKLNIALNILICLITLALVFEIVFCMNYQGIYVVGPSMNDTLTGAASEDEAGGDFVYVNKHAKPTYGDIVVIFDDKENKTIIKRVIAMGGDFVKLDKGELWIKYAGSEEFVLKEESYVSEDKNSQTTINSFPLIGGKLDEDGFYVDEGHIFVLGDNRDISSDSRKDHGRNYKNSEVYGVVTEWSIPPKDGKSIYTSLHQFFYFDVPRAFGVK